MPSGAKRRKAAKKKKANINPSTNTVQGNENLKSEDDRESDNGEIGFSTSQDGCKHFNGESEVLEKDGQSSVGSSVDKDKSIEDVPTVFKSTQKTGFENDGATNSESELKYKDNPESKLVHGKHTDCAKDSRHGDYHTSFRSSSSDDDSPITKKKQSEVQNSLSKTNYCDYKPDDTSTAEENKVSENAPSGKNENLLIETVSLVNSVVPEVSVSEETITVAENAAVENQVVYDVISLGFEEVAEKKKLFSAPDEANGASKVLTDLGVKENEEKALLSGKNDKLSSSVAEKKNLLSAPDEANGNSNILVNLGVKESDEKALSLSGKNDKMSPSSAPLVSEVRNSAEYAKYYEKPESFENQPLVASAPRVAQRTSWLSCCGLFDVLTNSSR